MLQIDTNMQELPQKRNPKSILEGQIQENALWIAQVLASKLYQKRKNIQEIRLTFAEVLDLIEDWHRDWNPVNQKQEQSFEIFEEVTRKRTIKAPGEQQWQPDPVLDSLDSQHFSKSADPDY